MIALAALDNWAGTHGLALREEGELLESIARPYGRSMFPGRVLHLADRHLGLERNERPSQIEH